ncbi:hypothetical protein OPV22_008466 [Ensete ventricosum]|uniref:Uncharacterized protein n=1 Tax=Ensete ventricosum TaxID=4639 RepID=A0AAV8R8E1_ENSVE|nr:hypothetical protein OPV22_008466 [Ensete ventricosum]
MQTIRWLGLHRCASPLICSIELDDQSLELFLANSDAITEDCFFSLGMLRWCVGAADMSEDNWEALDS